MHKFTVTTNTSYRPACICKTKYLTPSITPETRRGDIILTSALFHDSDKVLDAMEVENCLKCHECAAFMPFKYENILSILLSVPGIFYSVHQNTSQEKCLCVQVKPGQELESAALMRTIMVTGIISTISHYIPHSCRYIRNSSYIWRNWTTHEVRTVATLRVANIPELYLEVRKLRQKCHRSSSPVCSKFPVSIIANPAGSINIHSSLA